MGSGKKFIMDLSKYGDENNKLGGKEFCVSLLWMMELFSCMIKHWMLSEQ